MKTYTVYKGQTYAQPSLTGSVGDRLTFDFILDYTWLQLYQNEDNSTHKICGVSDLFGKNSVRMGVRRADKKVDSLVAVPYIHNKGVIDYAPFRDLSGRIVKITWGVKYRCYISKVSNGWKIELWNYDKETKLAECITPISISTIRRLSAMYIQVGSQPSLWTISTQMQIISK